MTSLLACYSILRSKNIFASFDNLPPTRQKNNTDLNLNPTIRTYFCKPWKNKRNSAATAERKKISQDEVRCHGEDTSTNSHKMRFFECLKLERFHPLPENVIFCVGKDREKLPNDISGTLEQHRQRSNYEGRVWIFHNLLSRGSCSKRVRIQL